MEYVQGSFFEGKHRAPLADRLRPQSLEEYLGQEHILGPGKALRRLIESDQVTSMIFWGPPGVGKTTLAMIIAQVTKARFLSEPSSPVPERAKRDARPIVERASTTVLP